MQDITNLNFKANYISTVQIKKRNLITNNFADCSASLVQLVSMQDLNILNKVHKSWRAPYSYCILNDAKRSLSSNQDHQHKFFALTLQNDSFDTLSFRQILGLAKVTNDFNQDIYSLDYLQTKPRYKYRTNTTRRYKNIGTKLVNEIKKICSDKPLVLLSDKSAKPFYKKNGFVEDKEKSDIFYWNI